MRSGLSPLARGTHKQLSEAIQAIRFIPAGAGNTYAVLKHHRSLTVYPRWRGEHGSLDTDPTVLTGLSPLARGTHQHSFPEGLWRRFIPAGAGNTRYACQSLGKVTVYPRWRGEHFPIITAAAPLLGLSPLARGTHQFTPGSVCHVRFIPAGAGNTHFAEPALMRLKVYPRWRGEHVIHRSGLDRSGGLSPLARGTLGYKVLFDGKARFIPAGAGNTSGILPL